MSLPSGRAPAKGLSSALTGPESGVPRLRNPSYKFRIRFTHFKIKSSRKNIPATSGNVFSVFLHTSDFFAIFAPVL